MHAHKWKRGAEETEATVKEIRRKVGQIAPAYNNGGTVRPLGSFPAHHGFG